MKNGFENILREEMFADFKWNPNFLNVYVCQFLYLLENTKMSMIKFSVIQKLACFHVSSFSC